jgi:heme/copper-type cytochrome/quinol oxidase subunit 2
VAEIRVAGGRVAGGVKRIQVDVGKTVTLGVTDDIDEELHVHGYDIKRDLTAGARVDVVFTADIPGVFDVELEHSGLKVAELQVG